MIQHGVVSPSPDLPLDPAAPPVLVPEGVLCGHISDVTLVHQPAFWALFQSPGTSDVIHSYWTQRLLWEIRQIWGVFPLHSPNNDPGGSPITDDVWGKGKETPQNSNTTRDLLQLMDFLTAWSCPERFGFYECVLLLSREMVKRKFWGEDVVQDVSFWLDTLSQVRYIEPDRVFVDLKTVSKNQRALITSSRNKFVANRATKAKFSEDIALKWALRTNNGVFVNFLPVIQSEVSKSQVSPYTSYESKVTRFCSDVPKFSVNHNETLNSPRINPISNVLVVVVFNYVVWLPKNIGRLEIMHRHFFPNIIYCGDYGSEGFEKMSKEHPFNISYIHAPIINGTFDQMCLSTAMNMRYNVSGYLVVADDAMLHLWNILRLDTDKIWMTEVITHPCSIEQAPCPRTSAKWYHWARHKPRANKALKNIRSLEVNSHSSSRHFSARDFFNNIARNLGSSETCAHGLADVYYIPRHFADKFNFFIDFFTKTSTFMEVAVPVTIFGIAKPSEIFTFNSWDLRGGEREYLWDYYNRDLNEVHYLHPIKFSNKTNHLGFCTNHLNNLLEVARVLSNY